MTRPGRLLSAFLDAHKRQPRLKDRDWAAAQLRERLNLAAHRGVKFIGPQGVKIDKSKPMLLSDLRPPYPVTVVEGELFDMQGATALIIAHDTGEHVELNFICRMDDGARALFPHLNEWMFSPFTCRFRYSDASIHEPYEMEAKPLLRDKTWAEHLATDSYKPILRFYIGVCQILANHDVETQDVEPDAKENRIRRIRGKAPLYTYKTLTIGAPKTRQVGKGRGTHASPRSHLRRGFYRTSKNGVRHWVQATMVKGETPGFVHKDYRVEQKGLTND